MKKNIVIIILSVLVVGLVTYIVLNEINDGKTESNAANDINVEENKSVSKEYNDFISESTYVTKLRNETYTVDVDVSKYNNIFEYIEKQDNVSMQVTYCTAEDSNNIVAGGTSKFSGKYTFNSAEVNTILNEMKQSSQNTKGGLGGLCVPQVTINYQRNGVSKYLNLYSTFSITETNDGNIYKIYDKNITYEITFEDANYGFDTLSETLNNKIQEVANK